MFARSNNRAHDELREIKFTREYTKHAAGSVLVEFGDTKVIVTASIDEKVPRFLQDTGQGWLTAEYSLLPGSTNVRVNRERGSHISGRTQEIQRLIGRSLRAIVDLKQLGERTLIVDADVIQADGGTRTAAISGAYVAVFDALKKLVNDDTLKEMPLRDSIAAISVGSVKGQVLLDLEYMEDSAADVDANIVMTGSGKIVEFQSTSEKVPFSKEDLLKYLEYGEKGINQILKLQRQVLGL